MDFSRRALEDRFSIFETVSVFLVDSMRREKM
jgi:hypothetical protein